MRKHTSLLAIYFASFALFVIALSSGAIASDAKGHKPAKPCSFSDARFDGTVDLHAVDEYQDALAQLLKQEKFTDLDCIADAARSGKTRFAGGSWKLHKFYVGLDTPRPGHPTQDDWKQHLKLVKRWVDDNPNSVTAPVVLARSYVSYAWDARGDGYADTVSDNGWKVFHERMMKAEAALKDSDFAGKCPEWFVAMMQVAQGESWGLSRFKPLFEQAVAYQRDYEYYYRVYAIMLSPKWFGAEGEAARFAEETADRVGGEAGDLLYFDIADEIVCPCDEPDFGHFSWPRLQKGHAALEKKYGTSLMEVNSFALMAVKFTDWEVAEGAFKRIGDNWNEKTWSNEAWFKQNRDFALQMGPMQAETRRNWKQARANMQTREGQVYRKELEQKLAAFERPCLDQSKGDLSKMEMFVQVGANGAVANAQTEKQPTPFVSCLMNNLYTSFSKKETPFAAPPNNPYWLVLEVDPATLSASAK